jgi:hypothetical protein
MSPHTNDEGAMSKRKINSRTLRQLAEELFERIAASDEFRQVERAAFVTSLVRQWITYEGNAAFFRGDHQLYLVLGHSPLGRPVVPESCRSGWTRTLTRDWKIDPDDLPALFDQLNVGQSAEAVNGDGVPLRLWVNPQERVRGVEPLVKEKPRPRAARDYRKIASDSLIDQFGGDLDPEETDELARSVVSQWQRFDGHASLFLDSHTELHVTITEQGDGGCNVLTSRSRVDLGAVLSADGFARDVFPEVIARINLGQQIEFRDRQGVRACLWYDPKARRFSYRRLDPLPPPVLPPFLCPKCTAVLMPWRDGDRQQTCPLCGHTVPVA